jgi:hypothetical protein
MKKQLLAISLAICLIGAAACSTEGYVTARPDDVVYARPVAPGPDYIWIDGDWVWSGGRYTWHEGHWDHSRPGHVWHGGSWVSGGHGWHWNHGRWG